jgi:hypothetical protein
MAGAADLLSTERRKSNRQTLSEHWGEAVAAVPRVARSGGSKGCANALKLQTCAENKT